MHDQPSIIELIQSVKHFIDQTASPQLTGHAGFHARVASNVLDIILRDLSMRAAFETAEAERLRHLLPASDATSLELMTADLCAQIRAGSINASTPGLFAHLRQTVQDQLAIDQPDYSGLQATRPIASD